MTVGKTANILIGTTVFNIDNNHVTLKTGVMMLQIQIWSQEYITFKIN